MKYLSGFCLLLIIGSTGCSQSHDMQRAYAFVRNVNYGTIATDDRGKALTPGSKTERIIYVESKNGIKPNITEINYSGSVVKAASLQLVTKNQLPLQLRSKTGEIIKIEPGRGNTLWKLELNYPSATDPGKLNADKVSVNSEIIANTTIRNKLIIKEIKKRRSFYITVYEIELEPIMGL